MVGLSSRMHEGVTSQFGAQLLNPHCKYICVTEFLGIYVDHRELSELTERRPRYFIDQAIHTD